jgi:4-amino-4-deoxy-L-arabinose transferase-like glycosyltransferase
MKPWIAACVVAVAWAGIYLPGLGDIEYKGEEPRRIQPAIAMLDTGDWLVPRIGGQIYYKKPPVINWLVAGSFLAFDRNEFAARLPSVLSVLALALVIALGARSWLTPGGALCAALIFLSHVAMIDKGRLIEIEAVYIAEFGIAFVAWVGAWMRGYRDGRLWIAPWIFLGLGVITKGPPLIAFFYVIVVAVLWRERALKTLLNPWHFAGVAAGLIVVGSWVVPFFLVTSGPKALGTYYNQMAMRVAGESDQLASWEWLLNLPKSLGNFLPWTLFVPLLWWRRAVGELSECERPVFLGLRDGATLLFIVVGFLPGVAPRYVMPLLAVYAVLIGWMFARCAPLLPAPFKFWKWVLVILSLVVAVAMGAGFLVPGDGVVLYAAVGFVIALAVGLSIVTRREQCMHAIPLTVRTAGLASACVFAYAAFVPPALRPYNDVKPVAAMINARWMDGETLVAVDPESRPFLAYLKPGVRYARKFSELPPTTNLVIYRSEREEDREKAGIAGAVEERFRDRGGDEFVLLRVQPKRP